MDTQPVKSQLENDEPAGPTTLTMATPVGSIRVEVTEVGIARIRWVEPGRDRLPTSVPDEHRAQRARQALTAYFAGEASALDLPVDWRHTSGTQRTVLTTLHSTVGYGSSITYSALAERSDTGIPARGIGAIMGSNPVPLVVPCHRVLAHDGLGGYSGGRGGNGLEVKRWLLALEGVLPPMLTWPEASGESSGELS